MEEEQEQNPEDICEIGCETNEKFSEDEENEDLDEEDDEYFDD